MINLFFKLTRLTLLDKVLPPVGKILDFFLGNKIEEDLVIEDYL